jgi:phenylpropionate dioxygenase-like ring-hydroxylating dioxygenase large terminal subunit
VKNGHQRNGRPSAGPGGDAKFGEFFAEMADLLEQGLIPARVLNDPELYALEKERLFARAWSFIGHESEIPEPGDYALRYIGEDPFIFSRDEVGEIHVLFNACRHRGTQVCRVERGNTSHFRCPYHGWTYDNSGALIGMPAARDASTGLDLTKWGLLEAPKMANFHGMVFACLDDDAPSFDEYLGDMKYYLDMFFELNDNMEVMGDPTRWTQAANWKSGAENFAGDDYHLIYLHRSMFEVDVIQIPFAANMLGHHVLPGNGHAIAVSVAEHPEELAYWGYPPEVTSKYDLSRLTDTQRDLAQRSRVLLGTVFPNLSMLTVPLTGNPHKNEPTAFTCLRLWQPRGPATMEIWNWILVPKDASPEFRMASYKAGMATFASGGLFDQDDAEPWQSIARTGGSTFARKAGMEFNYQQGLGIGSARAIEGFPGPGLVFDHRYEEGNQRVIFERWLEYVSSAEYPAMTGAPTLHPRNGSQAGPPVRMKYGTPVT